jgi:hypothetical protein
MSTLVVGRVVPALLVAMAVMAFGAASAPRAAAVGCANEAIRNAQASEELPLGTAYLPDCMALEMVSPPEKFGQEASQLSTFSSDGGSVLFNAKAALAETPGQQAFVGDNYVASRNSTEWVPTPTSPPADAKIVFGGRAAGGPYAFSSDLRCWLVFGATSSQRSAGEGQVFKGCADGYFSPLSPILQPIDDSGEPRNLDAANFFANGASADLSTTVFRAFSATTAYLPGDPRSSEKFDPKAGGKTNPEPGGGTDSYVAHSIGSGQPVLELLTRDKAGTVYGGRCGSALGGGGSRASGGLNQGAISANGARVYFSTRPAQPPSLGSAGPACSTSNPVRILKRIETAEGPEISELIPGGPSAPGDDVYQGASLDGSKVLLVTPRKLALSDHDASAEACSATVGASKGCDLYLYDADLSESERLIQVSAGGNGDPTPGESANVLSSITAISPDGSHIYFVAQGVLTTDPNPVGAVAQPNQPNLYMYERDAAHSGGHTAFISTLAAGDSKVLWGSGVSFAPGVAAVPLHGSASGGDGHVLFIVSKASLTTNDTDGGRSDVFRYDSTEATLLCVSCAPGGSPDAAPFSATAGLGEGGVSSNVAEYGRWVSEDGSTATFATAEPLMIGDVDGVNNPYLWKNEQVTMLPGEVGEKQFEQIDQLPVMSANGQEVGFSTSTPLLPEDGDTARDAYLVRADGGFPVRSQAILCNPISEGSCQGSPSVKPSGRVPSSNSFTGPGNAAQPVSCKKNFVRRKGKCVKKHQKNAHHKKSKHHGRQSSKKRGGSQ